MIYIVSGYMRTGTSMMMDALSAGGLDAAKNPNRDKLNQFYGDDFYKPNPNGFYELSRQEYLQPNFPTTYDGKLLKLLHGGLPFMTPHQYRIVFMRRNPEEIRQSYDAFFGGINTRVKHVVENYKRVMDDVINRLRNRKDIHSLAIFEYREVVDNPKPHFEKLVQTGWPIDVEKAAGVVDESLCRFRLENLVTGI